MAPMRTAAVLALLAVAAVGVAAALRLRQPLPAPAPPAATPPPDVRPEAPRAAAGDPTALATADALAPGATRQAPPPPPGTEWTAPAQALLARAPDDPSLTLVTAEVLAVDAISRSARIEGAAEHQDVTLRLLTGSGDEALRRYATVVAPLCPAVSQQQFGCSTPFGSLAPGQVRTFVLGRGRPDLGTLPKWLAPRARWLVLAGPEVARPDDPVLAKVPPELRGWLGRPSCNVFRARVGEVREGHRNERDGRASAQEFDHLAVDVLEVVQQAGQVPLRGRVRLAPEPFVGKLNLSSLLVGREYWFAADDAALFQVLRAFAPAN